MINELGLSAPFKSVVACRPPRNLPLSFDERDLETEQPLLLTRQISTLPAVLQPLLLAVALREDPRRRGQGSK